MKAWHNSHSLIYRMPFGAVTSKSEIRIRFSLADAGIPDFVNLVYEWGEEKIVKNMNFIFDAADVCFYESTITAPKDTGLLRYWFQFGINKNTYYYGNNEENLGGVGILSESCPNKYQITVYDENFETPKWWREGVCYQIFPDRFYNGNETKEFLGNRTDIIKREWGDTPFYKPEQFGGKYLANDFFGGNLIGIEKKLPYLKELGISCIYLNPIFKAYSNHRYDTGNYKEIDEVLGTEKDFERLCKKADNIGIKIILDGVFNHTGSDSLYFNKFGNYQSIGAYQSKESPYYEWFNFTNYPNEYESWWGIDTLPQVNENSEELRKYILTDKDAVVKKWLKSGAMGWRLDVVDEIPDDFVRILRSEVKNENKDAVIIGEVWEDASNKVAYDKLREYFLGKELDSVMNYPLKNALVDFALLKIDALEFDRRIMSIKENYPKPCYYATLNFLSTHDTERILTVLGGKNIDNKDEKASAKLSSDDLANAKNKLKCLVTMQFLFPGVPTIFYADEVGVEGYQDPFCRCCFPWGKEDNNLLEHYKRVIKLRNTSEALKNGEFETVYKFKNSYGFIRYNDNEKIIALSNFGDEYEIRLDMARYGVFEMTDETGNVYNKEDGVFYINMPKDSVKIFKA